VRAGPTAVSTSIKAGRGAIEKLSEGAFIEVMGTKLPMAVTKSCVTATFGWAFSLDRGLLLFLRLLGAFQLKLITANHDRSSPAATKRSSGAILARWRVWGRWVADLARVT